MMRKVVLALLLLFILLNIINAVLLIKESNLLFQPAQEDQDFGIVSFEILNPNPEIYIHSPLNETYDFNYSDINIYLLHLNATSNFDADNWSYILLYLEKNPGIEIFYGPYSRFPLETSLNITMEAGRWSNLLTVYGQNTATGVEANASVEFFINVSNHAPLLGYFPNETFVCESSKFNDTEFNATDIDEDILELSMENNAIFAVWPFDTRNEITESYLGFAGYTFAWNYIYLLAPGKNLTKTHIGLHELTLLAKDNGIPMLSDNKKINITVIEINNPLKVETIGVQTVWAYGSENRTFYEEVDVNDIECQRYGLCDFSFNLTFLDSVKPFFEIDEFGVINFTANKTYLGLDNSSVVYNLTLCVTDSSLTADRIHENITDFCGQDGSNMTTCQNFSLTVTAENRQPRIESYHPKSLNFSASRGQELYFNITDYDPDGTIPDTYWYAGSSLIEYDPNSNYDELHYTFQCGNKGVEIIKVEITDGKLNDSLQWNVTLDDMPCPSEGGVSGGGGGGRPLCSSIWDCSEWNICQNVSFGLQLGSLAGEEYRFAQEECSRMGLSTDICGFQTRTCLDMNNCSRTEPKELQACYYSVNPTCFDGIKNCHSGGCEFLVDCNGPCEPCSTCSDKIRNQGEEGVDCGGPCPNRCLLELPGGTVFLNYLAILIIVLLIVIVIILFYRFRRERKKVITH